jgi:Asp-tRNA(Asn)/Glu-tRNA(Gln) amidotransferase A subunit family amidase
MALSWSMDKVGPICRSVEDCALVLDAIRGADGKDGDVIDAGFHWDPRRNPGDVRLGYDAEAFEEESDDKPFHDAALAALKEMGFDPVPVKLPDLPPGDMLFILESEAAAAFDQLTRSGQDDLLVRQIEQAWPNVFRAARLIPAVEYIQANRARTLLMRGFEKSLAPVDVYVHPTYGGKTLLAANLTGHPTLVMPAGFRENGTPASISFTGRLFDEGNLCLVGKAFQDTTGFHEKHPSL